MYIWVDRCSFGQITNNVFCEVAMNVEDDKPSPIFDVLPDHVFNEIRLAAA
jgi:hypothetical protein